MVNYIPRKRTSQLPVANIWLEYYGRRGEKSMQYLLMCYFSEDRWEKIPKSQRDEIMQEYGDFVQQTRKSGHLRAGAKLALSPTAATVRTQNGKPIITDGPFAETKEQLGGYHVMECQDLEEAIAIARRIPTLGAGGTIEVRAIESLE
jgi:hypothetical protein